MHVHYLDPYQPRHSPIHNLDSRVKLALALAYLLSTSLTPAGAWASYILLAAILLSAERLSDLPFSYFLRRAILALPFIFAALPLPLTTPGHIVAEFSLGGLSLRVSAEGLIRSASIALKFWLSIQMAVLLTVSTPFPELLQALRALRVPRLLVAIFGLTWRYLFVFADEALRLMRARSARSGQHPQGGYRSGRTLAWRAQVTGSMAGSLFLRALERSERIYMAMLARGYDGEVRMKPLPPLPIAQSIFLWIGIGILTLIAALGHFLTRLG
ncbi:MAG: cobalt ECF transporter T component CbiQ [Anaerolineales bacterium]|nr:cobalt ECF transporter T component CbiQ [Anaerolineales bacterium]MCS7247517.1 cobalt ECF transporter T component CbiQ [Anaerolineales bacterium]MDW8161328.1 cobalt ECF transporter T component CbiQ [Anaerolineales bacterium]MDW8446577.1 cobalt ECF transporter T component CbiQ [Anaerolineales bacterium]